MKVQYVTGVHGNEPMPTLALASMGVGQIVANPRALARGVRCVEKDLNASFMTRGNSYEERRARELDKIIADGVTVIDFHTYSCESEPFVIIVDLEMLPLAKLVGARHVVYFDTSQNIKGGHALINHHPGVSVEVGKHAEEKSFIFTQETVNRLEGNNEEGEVRVYQVCGRIEEQRDYRNFVEVDGMVPVLYGERAYPDQGFYGLKAREITGTIRI